MAKDRIQVCIPDELKDKFDATCQKYPGIPKSNVVLMLVCEALTTREGVQCKI